MALINTLNFNKVKNFVLPPVAERMRTAYTEQNYSAEREYIYDLSYAENDGSEIIVQSLTVDNTANDAPLFITSGSGLKYYREIPAGEFRVFNIPAVVPTWLKVNSAGTGTSRVYFHNFPNLPEVQTEDSLSGAALTGGAPGTGISQPAGGSGIYGWLSGIYKACRDIYTRLGATLSFAGSTRAVLGHQTLSVTTGAVVTLTVPANAVAADIQADGYSVSVTLDGTAPTATIGTRIDDGVIYPVTSALANVKLIARTNTTIVQIVYFDKV